jgi:hypothetical protein
MVLPEIHSTINDISAAAGLRLFFGNWNFDLSNTFGKVLIMVLKIPSILP